MEKIEIIKNGNVMVNKTSNLQVFNLVNQILSLSEDLDSDTLLYHIRKILEYSGLSLREIDNILQDSKLKKLRNVQ